MESVGVDKPPNQFHRAHLAISRRMFARVQGSGEIKTFAQMARSHVGSASWSARRLERGSMRQGAEAA